jgi:hypothetical protein
LPSGPWSGPGLSRWLTAFLALALLAGAPARADRCRRVSVPSPSTFSVMTYNVEGLPWPVRKGRGEALKKIGFELAAMRVQGRGA